MLIIEQLTNQENFTSNEQKIADYILENLTKIPTIDIKKLPNTLIPHILLSSD